MLSHLFKYKIESELEQPVGTFCLPASERMLTELIESLKDLQVEMGFMDVPGLSSPPFPRPLIPSPPPSDFVCSAIQLKKSFFHMMVK